MKVCKVCSVEKPTEAFPKDGRLTCKECANKKQRAKYSNMTIEERKLLFEQKTTWRKNNPEKTSIIKKREYEKNKSKYSAANKRRRERVGRTILNEEGRRWREKNPEKAKLSDQKRYKTRVAKEKAKNPAYFNIRASERRARIHNATPPWVDKEHKLLIEEIYRSAKTLSEFHEIPYDVDHIEPLKGCDANRNHISCGLHVHWNLRPVPAFENRKKWAKIENTTN